MKRDKWNDLATFAAVARAGSFTRAGVALGITPSAVSHAIKAFEGQLGLRLLNRSTRSVGPTAEGEQLLAALTPAMDGVEACLDRLLSGRTRPAGRVRVSAHRAAALHVLLPRLGAFKADYPDVVVELNVDDGLVDIVAAGYDVGVRHGHVLERNMISVKISEAAPLAVVASPAYLDRHGRPTHPDQLLGHRCLVLRLTTSGALFSWPFRKNGQAATVETPQSVVSNDVDVLLEAAVAGLGVTIVSPLAAAPLIAAGRLERLLEDWCEPIPPNFLYYLNRQHISPALRAFVDAMKVGA